MQPKPSPSPADWRGVKPEWIPWLRYLARFESGDHPGGRLLIGRSSRIGGLLMWVVGLIPWLLLAKYVLPYVIYDHAGLDGRWIGLGMMALLFGWMLVPGLVMLQNEQRLLLTRQQLSWRQGPLPWPRQQNLPAMELADAERRTTVTKHRDKKGKEYTTRKHFLVLARRNGSPEIKPFGELNEDIAIKMAAAIRDFYRLQPSPTKAADKPAVVLPALPAQRLEPGAGIESLLRFTPGLPHLAVPLVALLLTAGGVELWSEQWSVDLWRSAQQGAATAQAEAAALAALPPATPLTITRIDSAHGTQAKGVLALDETQLAALPALETLRQQLRTGLTAAEVDDLLSPLTSQVTPADVFDQRRATLWASELAPQSDFVEWIRVYGDKLWLRMQAKMLPLLGMEPPKKKAVRRAEEAWRVLNEPPAELDFETLQITPVLLDPPLAVAQFYAPDDPATDNPALLVGWLLFEQTAAAPAEQSRAVAEAYVKAFPEARPRPIQPLTVLPADAERDAEIERVLAAAQAAVQQGDRDALLALLHPVAAAMLRTTDGWDEWLTTQMAALKPQLQMAYDITDRGDRAHPGARYLILAAQGQPPEAESTPKGYAYFTLVDGRWLLRDLGWGEAVLLGF